MDTQEAIQYGIKSFDLIVVGCLSLVVFLTSFVRGIILPDRYEIIFCGYHPESLSDLKLLRLGKKASGRLIEEGTIANF
jgi:hypothetical protein